MSFAGMASQLLGEPVDLAAWAGPVLLHLVDGETRQTLRNAPRQMQGVSPRLAPVSTPPAISPG